MPASSSARNPTMTVRRLTQQNASLYRALMLQAYRRHPDAFTSGAEEREVLPLSWWEARLDPSPAADEQVFGAWHEGDLVAVAGVSFEARLKSRHKGTLFGMYVSEAVRRHGAGRALVLAVQKAARARPGVRVLVLTVTEGNRGAQALYESCGFRAFGTEPMAICVAGQFLGKIHMSCLLDRY